MSDVLTINRRGISIFVQTNLKEIDEFPDIREIKSEVPSEAILCWPLDVNILFGHSVRSAVTMKTFSQMCNP